MSFIKFDSLRHVLGGGRKIVGGGYKSRLNMKTNIVITSNTYINLLGFQVLSTSSKQGGCE